jgi:tetratricopeptide (TPR) repeat protein
MDDFTTKMAIIEDEVYSEGSGNYIVGLIRTHNGMGLTPSPGDLMDLSIYQSLNSNAVLMIFDIFSIKSAANIEDLGVKIYQLINPMDPNGDTYDINWTIPDFNQNIIQDMTAKFRSSKLPLAQIDALVNKAWANIQIGDYNTGMKFLNEAKQLVGNKLEAEVTIKIDFSILEIYYRQQLYKQVIQGIEMVKQSYGESKPDEIMAEIGLLLGRVLVKLEKRDLAIKSFEEASKLFEKTKNWKKLALVHLLQGLIKLPSEGSEPALISMMYGLSAISHLRSDNVKDYLINKLNLERNAKNLIKTLNSKKKQGIFLNMLNEMSEKHGYK